LPQCRSSKRKRQPLGARHLRLVATSAILALVTACGSASKPAAREVQIWRLVGSWSGAENAQTEAFIGDTGALRVRWKTSSESPAGAGVFKLTVHSAVSGRPLEVVVDHRGAGEGVAYVDQEPREFYSVVEASNLNWTFTIEEASRGKLAGAADR
jgi:hypothetical protein